MSEQPITLTVEDQSKSNPKASIVRAEVRSARGYANQRAHDLSQNTWMPVVPT